MDKSERHYLTCQDPNCERAYCVDRRNRDDSQRSAELLRSTERVRELEELAPLSAAAMKKLIHENARLREAHLDTAEKANERVRELENALISARDELGSATSDKASRNKVLGWCNAALEPEDSAFKHAIMQSQLTSRDESRQERKLTPGEQADEMAAANEKLRTTTAAQATRPDWHVHHVRADGGCDLCDAQKGGKDG